MYTIHERQNGKWFFHDSEPDKDEAISYAEDMLTDGAQRMQVRDADGNVVWDSHPDADTE